MTLAVPPAPTLAQRGFTLMELAIVMLIVSLLIGGMLLPLTAQQDIRARYETEKVLSETRNALMGYAIVNTYLPCPDIDGDGAEDVTGTGSTRTCTSPDGDGDFPYQTVGTSQTDGFNYRLRYRVAADFAKTFTISSLGDITVISRGDDPTTSGTTETKSENKLIEKSPAVIISVGKNGYGGRPFGGGSAIAVSATNTDEVLNNSGNKKVSRTPTAAQSPCSDTAEGSTFCEFDDQLVWISTNALFNRMVAAGKLP